MSNIYFSRTLIIYFTFLKVPYHVSYTHRKTDNTLIFDVLIVSYKLEGMLAQMSRQTDVDQKIISICVYKGTIIVLLSLFFH
jgi:hypothetical protein